ncbi:MAG: hypothetical protein IT580_08015 [Verrucomicrobiales bacterium]|nr:hypothetical protein [Verrucomicrobiales bacterium]
MTSIISTPRDRALGRPAWLLASLLACAARASAQEVLLQEGFNTDGTTANPPRYTLTGRGLYEPQRIRDELANFDQKGPIYWEHSFNVSLTGNPENPGRRAIVAWRGTDGSTATPDFLQVFGSTVDWLLSGKKNAQIVVHPNAASIQGLADYLTSAGHTVVDDDIASTPNELDVAGDLFVHGPGSSNPSRFVLLPKPVIVMNAPDYDDMLVGSIGTAVTFAPGSLTVASPSHPAAGGKTGTFDALSGDQPFELVGRYLPTNAVTLATITRTVTPAVNNLDDVDAMVAGTKTHEKTSAQVVTLDFADGSAGSWSADLPGPGNYTGNWGLVAKGKVSVATAGTYRFALGSDDGARLAFDLDRNGITTGDVVLTDAGPHAHQIVYVNVAFPSAGAFDFEVVSYNSSGGGSLELWVANTSGEVPDDNLDSGYWEVLGVDGASSPVKLQGQANVTGYIASGPTEQRQEPVIVVLNGPNDSPKGVFYDGGKFANFEGAGFLGGSGLNKWPYPDGISYRAVQLAPVNVAGKKNVKLTVALAATVVDFEDSDFIDLYALPAGASSTPVRLAHFRGVQNGIQPWLADEMQGFVRRLTREFADFTYDVPAGATDLVIEIRVASSWWTETLAVDNIRVTAGVAASPLTLGKPTLAGTDLVLTWTGGQPPYDVEQATALSGGWTKVLTTSSTTANVPRSNPAGFLRVRSGGP